MDVDRQTFYPQLLSILEAIADAHFVAIDLEMSGIALQRNTQNSRALDNSNPELQTQYTQIKAAAEKFHVLQVGITCVCEDRKNGYYQTRPYNILISPLFLEGEKLGIDRQFSF